MTALPLSLFTLAVVLLAFIGRLAVGQQGTGLRALFRSSRLLRAQGTLLIVVLALAPVVLQRPWLPMQAIHAKDGRVLVGYVLGDPEPQLAVLQDKDRTVVFVAATDIVSRQICSGRASIGGLAKSAPRIDFSGSFLGALLWGDQLPKYPSCPAPKPEAQAPHVPDQSG